MKNIFVFIFLLSKFNCVIAQEFDFGLSYKYMYSNQWDKLIQTYNFSRPFITKKQPLLMNGSNASISYIFKSTKRLKQGINLSYSYFRSSSQNENFKNVLNLHFINIGYTIHFNDYKKMIGLYTDLIISVTSSGIFRNINGKPFLYDEKKAKAFGIGGDISLKIGYKIKFNTQSSFSPFISLGYTPYLYSPNTETLINQTKGMTSKNWTNILSTQIGLSFHI
jgi:hypothetical protein